MKKTRERQIAKGILIVRNDRGLHTRPATELVKCSVNFKSEIKLRNQKQEVNAKSLLGILMLAAAKGTKIQIEAEGPDAPEAVEALINLANLNFNVCY